MENQKTAQKLIKKTLLQRGIDYSLICKKLNIEQSHFLNCMNEKSSLNAAEFLSLCSFLELGLDDFKKAYII